jgi:hypothetical protein
MPEDKLEQLIIFAIFTLFVLLPLFTAISLWWEHRTQTKK